jgi:hypothetical protein
MLSHYGQDHMESMHLRRMIDEVQKKLSMPVKKSGFLRMID